MEKRISVILNEEDLEKIEAIKKYYEKQLVFAKLTTTSDIIRHAIYSLWLEIR